MFVSSMLTLLVLFTFYNCVVLSMILVKYNQPVKKMYGHKQVKSARKKSVCDYDAFFTIYDEQSYCT